MENDVDDALTNEKLINVSLDYKSMRDVLSEMTMRIEQTTVQIKEIKQDRTVSIMDERIDQIQDQLNTLIAERKENLSGSNLNAEKLAEDLEMRIEEVKNNLIKRIDENDALVQANSEKFTNDALVSYKSELLEEFDKKYITPYHLVDIQDKIDELQRKIASISTSRKSDSSKQSSDKVSKSESRKSMTSIAVADLSDQIAQLKTDYSNITSKVEPLDSTQKKLLDDVQQSSTLLHDHSDKMARMERSLEAASIRLENIEEKDVATESKYAMMFQDIEQRERELQDAIEAVKSSFLNMPAAQAESGVDVEKIKFEAKNEALNEVMPMIEELKRNNLILEKMIKDIYSQEPREIVKEVRIEPSNVQSKPKVVISSTVNTEVQLTPQVDSITSPIPTPTPTPLPQELETPVSEDPSAEEIHIEAPVVEIPVHHNTPVEMKPRTPTAPTPSVGPELDEKLNELQRTVSFIHETSSALKESMTKTEKELDDMKTVIPEQIQSVANTIEVLKTTTVTLEQRISALENRTYPVPEVPTLQVERFGIETGNYVSVETQTYEEEESVQEAETEAVHSEEHAEPAQPQEEAPLNSHRLSPPRQSPRIIKPDSPSSSNTVSETPSVTILSPIISHTNTDTTIPFSRTRSSILSQTYSELEEAVMALQRKVIELESREIPAQIKEVPVMVEKEIVKVETDNDAVLERIKLVESLLKATAPAQSVQRLAYGLETSVADLNQKIESIKQFMPSLVTKKDLNQILSTVSNSSPTDDSQTAGARMSYKCLLCGRPSGSVTGMITDAEVARLLGTPPISGMVNTKQSKGGGDRFALVYGKDGTAFRSQSVARKLPGLLPQ